MIYFISIIFNFYKDTSIWNKFIKCIFISMISFVIGSQTVTILNCCFIIFSCPKKYGSNFLLLKFLISTKSPGLKELLSLFICLLLAFHNSFAVSILFIVYLIHYQLLLFLVFYVLQTYLLKI